MADPLMIRGRPPRSAAVALLQAQGLPISDVTDEHLEHFFFMGSDVSPSGLVGLEIYGTDALLRSLAVRETARRKGFGSALIARAEQYASSKSVRSIYLLTTTAETFFKRLGYERIERSQAPPRIERTREFADLCPASSAFMLKCLKTTG
ncbi:MAG: arsenic resistance N-acetyltransferase ArsN2 [Steroidobacteraceae bacterium]